MNTSSTLLLLASLALTAACGAAADSADSSDPMNPGTDSPGADKPDAAPAHACHFTMETFTTCPDFSLPPDHTVECYDGVDCASLQSDDSIIAGCDRSTLYLDKVQIDGTCADWKGSADGGTDSHADARPATSPDASRPGDAGVSSHDSASTGDSSPSVCMPLDVSSFVSTWHPPTGGHQGKCVGSDIDGIYADCYGPSASYAECQAAITSPCGTCVFSQDSDAVWAALISSPDFTSVNEAGCVALLAPGDGACARTNEATLECEMAACGHCATATSLTSYNECVALADANGCSAYASSTACDAEADGGAAATCFANTTFQGAYRAISLVFCGP